MEIEKNLGKMALDLLKNEQLVKSTSDVFGMLFPYCGLRKKALDVYNWSKSDGANVCQWSYYGNANQQWIFEKC